MKTALAIGLAAGAWLCVNDRAAAEFVGLALEVEENVSHNGAGGSFENRDIVRLYAYFTPGSTQRVTSWGASPGGDPAMIENLRCEGTDLVPGSGFWASALAVDALVQPNNAIYGIDPAGFDFSSYLTIGNEAGYEPVISVITEVAFEFGLVPGFNPTLHGAAEIDLTEGGVFTTPTSPYGFPDKDNRVLLAQFNLADGEFVQGTINLTVHSDSGTFVYTDLFVGALSPCEAPVCPADLSGDEVVDVFDLLTLLGAWGDCPRCAADLNGDDAVDAFDLLELLAAWGPCE